MSKPLTSKIIATDVQSANFLKDDLFVLLLNPKEFKNVVVRNNRVIILDQTAIVATTASKAYQYLLKAAQSSRRFNVKYVTTGMSVTLSDGKTVLKWER